MREIRTLRVRWGGWKRGSLTGHRASPRPYQLDVVLSLTQQASRRMILRKRKVEIGNSGLTEFGTPSGAQEEK